PLFSANTTLSRALFAEMRVALRLSRHVEAEGAMSYGKPQLRIAATSDAENAAPVTATERVEEFRFTGGLLWYPAGFSADSRVAPFVIGEAGLLRALHEELTFVQD